MRLALVTHKVDLHDGQGQVNYEIARAALERGHEVTVVAEFCAAEIGGHPRGRFVQTRKRPIPTQLLRNVVFAFTSARWLRRHRAEFDLVQANGFVTWEPADIVAVHFVHTTWLRHAAFPFRWRSWNPYAWYQRLLAELNARWEHRAFASARVLVAVSQATAGELVEMGYARDRIRVIPNGVDVREFAPGAEERASFGLPEGAPLALFAGDIRTPRKNLETVLRALDEVPGVHLAVAGRAEESPYPAMAAALGLQDRVHFVGLSRRVPALMRSCDLFVLPSRYESYGMVVVEAMASGLPVIVSAQVGIARSVAEACVVLQDPEDAEELARAMRAILESPQRAEDLRAAGRAKALEMQWSVTVEGYLQLYEELSGAAEKGRDA